MPRGRYGKRRQQRRRAAGRRRMRRYGRKRVAGISHTVKRLGMPAFLQNTALGPTFGANTANGSIQMGPVIGGLLPGTNELGFSCQFKLDSVIDYADLTSLFDRYKIVGVKLKLHYLQNASFIPGNNANLPTIHYAFDGDDASTPANANTVLVKGYAKSRVMNANRPTSIYLRPRLTKQVWDTPIASGYTSEKACWLDCNSFSVPHYGLKVWISDWVAGPENNNALRIQPTYYLALRDTQ